MKTWDTAKQVHRNRLSWQARFGEVLSILEAAGVPPPDDLGGAHADWGTFYGVVRFGATLKNKLHLQIPREMPTPEVQSCTLETVEQVKVFAAALAVLLKRNGLPQSETTYEFVNTHNALTVQQRTSAAGRALMEARVNPYFDPCKP